MKPINLFPVIVGLIFQINGITNAQNCVNCYNTSTGTWSSAIGNGTTATGTGAFASGFESSATGNYSTSLGAFCQASGMRSIAVGGNSFAESDNSMALGYMVKAKQSNAFIIGTGFSLGSYMENTVQNSLMIGFGSNKSTLFISPATENEKTGKIGIGNVINPLAKVHIRTDVGEQAALLLEPWSWSGDNWSEIRFGNEQFAIRGTYSTGLIFKSPQSFVFSNGNVGINVNDPTEKLEVNGKVKTSGLQLTNGSFSGRLLQSDDAGNATWVDPAWNIKGSNIVRTYGNVGIGLINPTQKLDVNGTVRMKGIQLTTSPGAGKILQSDGFGFASWTSPAWTIAGNNVFRLTGNIGIGTTSPQVKLDISGDIRVFEQITGNTSGNLDKLSVKGSENQDAASMELGKGESSEQRFIKLITRQGGNIEFFTDSYLRMKITDNEIVIGTPPVNGTTQYVDLQVNGHVLTREVEVTPGEWWDDVLTGAYKLQEISEVESYIKQNCHLPGIPSQDEVLENGIRLGEFNGLLLKKIEELTLYIIELKKENEQTREMLKAIID